MKGGQRRDRSDFLPDVVTLIVKNERKDIEGRGSFLSVSEITGFINEYAKNLSHLKENGEINSRLWLDLVSQASPLLYGKNKLRQGNDGFLKIL
jgi:hypothetical protein